MEIRKTVEFRSEEIKWLMELKSKNELPLIKVALIKLGNLYIRARQQDVYIYLSFMPVLEKMTESKETLVKLIQRFEKAIVLQKVDPEKIHIQVKILLEFRIGSPVAGMLIELLELSDRLNCLLSIMHQFHLFQNDRSHFFNSAFKNQRRMQEILEMILRIDEEAIPAVTISDYLNRTEAYQNAAKSMGEIEPEMLFSAMKIGMLPHFHPKIHSQIIHQLKAME